MQVKKDMIGDMIADEKKINFEKHWMEKLDDVDRELHGDFED